ncbi:MAG: hypothetical protein AYK19_11170 [Theionarchaea archaeon DG-70-1]|nr:MAG: hypothetical protein AYK19_11170 [Theionarchaea archaeon DG-70-1]
MKANSHRFQPTIELLEKDCHSIVKETNVPGLSIALVTRDDTVWMEGFGYTDRKKTKKVDENTRFAYQSTGKSIVAAIALKAVQDGLISLDDPLIKYYPEFRVQSMYEEKAYKKITFRHLLSHTAGIQEGVPPGVGFDEKGEIHDPTYEERIESLQNSWLKFLVGQRAYYSNFGMDLVTYGLQRASGKPYPQFAKETFFYLLGMTSVIYDREEALKDSNTARGYLGDYEAVIRDSEAYGAGMPFLSIKDLAIFTRFLLNKGTLDGKMIVGQKYLEEMFKGDYSADYFAGHGSRLAHYGLGIFLNSINDVTVLHHPGRAFGYTSKMVFVPDLNIGVCVFANNEVNDPIGRLADKALRLMIGERIKIKEKAKVDRRNDPPVYVDVKKLKNLEGFYSSVGGVDLLVQYKDGSLFLSNHRLTPHSTNEFSSKDLPVVRFELNEQGGPKMLTFFNEDLGWWPAQFIVKYKKDLKPPTRRGWEDFTGLYIAYYYGIERGYFTITSRKDHLVAKSSDEEELLYESGVKPGLFFTFNDVSYEFVGDVLLVGNVKTFKCREPVKELLELADSEPTHRYVTKHSLEQLEEMLRDLNREKEADIINGLYERLYPGEKENNSQS